MIDPPEPRASGAVVPPEAKPARLPVSAGLGRLLVLAVVFLCAACGLVYELELVALASYLVGDSVTQASVVLSVMVFAMGIGSLLAKRLRCRAAVGFGAVEAALALVGGCSAMALYACFAWFGQSRSTLIGFSLAIGILIGAEVPLLMTLIQRVRRQDAGGAVADLFAADYVGALVGGLAFPFLLLPVLGQVTGALLTGAVNALAGGGLVLWLFRRDMTPRARWALLAANAAVLLLLATGTALVAPFERAARHAVYGSSARVAVQTGIQEVVMTGSADGGEGPGRLGAAAGGPRRGPLALYLDGRLRVSAADEFRYHEALVHPAMSGSPQRRVLVLGGGDGLAVREVLRHPGARAVTVVELDPGVVRLARTDPGLSALNRHSLDDPRVRVITADAFEWLRDGARSDVRRLGPYDVIICDLPDPGITASTKLYSQEFYGLTTRVLAPDGRLAVHAGPPVARAHAYWTVDATIRSVGLSTLPYRLPGHLATFSGGPDRSLTPGEGERGAGWFGAEVRGDAGGPGVFAPGRGGGPGRAAHYWGFILAARRPPALPPALQPNAMSHRDRSPRVPAAGPVSVPVPAPVPVPKSAPAVPATPATPVDVRVRTDDRIPGLPPSTLIHPRYLD